MKKTKPSILFLCTGNSCRSQMAEGWLRALRGETFTAFSAGLETHGLNPRAVAVMGEAGVDISHQRSTHLDEYADTLFDCVITVCANAHETCPLFPGSAPVYHRGFDDPPALVAAGASEQEALIPFRRVRDEIRDFILSLPDDLTTLKGDDLGQ